MLKDHQTSSANIFFVRKYFFVYLWVYHYLNKNFSTWTKKPERKEVRYLKVSEKKVFEDKTFLVTPPTSSGLIFVIKETFFFKSSTENFFKLFHGGQNPKEKWFSDYLGVRMVPNPSFFVGLKNGSFFGSKLFSITESLLLVISISYFFPK